MRLSPSRTVSKARRTRGRTRAKQGSAASVPIVEEKLVVDKAKFATGGVRATSRIEEHPVEETVTLRDEHSAPSSALLTAS